MPISASCIPRWLMLHLVLAAVATAQTGTEAEVERLQHLFDAGSSQQAIADLRTLIKQSPREAVLHRTLANFLSRTDDYRAAILAASAAIRLAPEDADALLERAFAHSNNRNAKAAERDFAKAIELRPRDCRAHGMLGDHMQQTDRVEASIGHYDTAIECNPNYRQGHAARAAARAKLGDYQGARNDAKRAMELGDDDPFALLQAASWTMECGDVASACEIARACADKFSDPTFVRSMAISTAVSLLIRSDRSQEAKTVLAPWLVETVPADVRGTCHQLSGILALLDGDRPAAATHFLAARTVNKSLDGWSRLMQWAATAEQGASAPEQLLPAPHEADPVIRSIAAMLRTGTGDQPGLVFTQFRGAEAGAAIFFSAWNACVLGREAESQHKLVRCVNHGGGTMQWDLAVGLLKRQFGPSLRASYGCNVEWVDAAGGLVVRSVEPWSAADLQALRVGDVIRRIGRQPASLEAWHTLPGQSMVGLSAHLTCRREGADVTLVLVSGYAMPKELASFDPGPRVPSVAVAREPEFTADAPESWALAGDSKSDLMDSLAYRVRGKTRVQVGKLGTTANAQLLNSWRSMMGLPGLDDSDVAGLPRTELLGKPAILLECAGKWQGLDGAGKLGDAEALLLVVIQENEGSPAFVRCVGPKDEVEASRAEFLRFVASLRRRH